MINLYYIVKGKCTKIKSYTALGKIIINENLNVQEVIRGPKWNPAIYFYLI